MRLFQSLLAAASLISAIVISSCGSSRPMSTLVGTSKIDLNYSNPASLPRYNGMTYGLNFAVTAPDASVMDVVRAIPNPSVQNYALIGLRQYASASGFMVGMDPQNDRILRVDINKFVYASLRMPPRVEIELTYSLVSPANEILFNAAPVSVNYTVVGNQSVASALNAAYVRALSQLNWQAIASKLSVPRTAQQAPLQQVQGNGDTALENTIIRWFVESAPRGCDVYWRVVSSTPDVHNSNSTYLGTTPYESTESFDIRGLTLENSGNVQIEVTCEKPGYLTQRRRFNLRQAIDQREISAKFNMVKDE